MQDADKLHREEERSSQESYWLPSDHDSQLFWQSKEDEHRSPQYGEPETTNNAAHETSEDDDVATRSLAKRSSKDISNWGSNPYLLGKRAFWTPRGKKSNEDYILNYPDLDGENQLYFPKALASYNYALEPYFIASSADVLPNQIPEDVPEESGVQNSHGNLNLVLPTDKRRNGLFWAARGKREKIEETSPDFEDDPENVVEKRSNSVSYPKLAEALWKNKADNSKFWMTRGRRFWAARGKKAIDSATFSRLARLVNAGHNNKAFIKLDSFGQSERGPDSGLGLSKLPVNGGGTEDQPIFWVVRGKKSDSVAGDDYSDYKVSPWELALANGREKKSANRYTSALAHLKSRGLNLPQFWANRGRKNFWAARGKR